MSPPAVKFEHVVQKRERKALPLTIPVAGQLLPRPSSSPANLSASRNPGGSFGEQRVERARGAQNSFAGVSKSLPAILNRGESSGSHRHHLAAARAAHTHPSLSSQQAADGSRETRWETRRAARRGSVDSQLAGHVSLASNMAPRGLQPLPREASLIDLGGCSEGTQRHSTAIRADALARAASDAAQWPAAKTFVKSERDRGGVLDHHGSKKINMPSTGEGIFLIRSPVDMPAGADALLPNAIKQLSAQLSQHSAVTSLGDTNHGSRHPKDTRTVDHWYPQLDRADCDCSKAAGRATRARLRQERRGKAALGTFLDRLPKPQGANDAGASYLTRTQLARHVSSNVRTVERVSGMTRVITSTAAPAAHTRAKAPERTRVIALPWNTPGCAPKLA